MNDDRLIFEEIKKGNQVAFKQLFDKYYYALKGFSRRYVTQEDVCEDGVQKAFVSLWENLNDFKYPSALKSYLFSTVRNHCINYVNREAKRKITTDDLEEFITDKTYKETIVEEEVYSEVYKAIKKLSPQSRRIVVLAMNGLKNQEIADELNISINTVKTLKKRAYEHLREDLKGASWVLILLLI